MAFADDVELLKGACGKSLASFPQGWFSSSFFLHLYVQDFFQARLGIINEWLGFACVAGCFYSTAVGGLRSFENPKNKITAIPAKEEEIWGATFKVNNSSRLRNHM